MQGLDLQYRQQPKNQPKMQEKQGVDHKQPADSYEWNNEECQLTLHGWTELSTVPNSTWLRNYCI